MNKKVSFDYDGTLDKPHVQEYCKSLIQRGDIDVWVCTFRCNDGEVENGYWFDNSDMFFITDELGIPRTNIIFTSMEDKSTFISDDFLWHLDDDEYVHFDMKKNSKVPSIKVKSSGYEIKCNKLLK